MSKFILTCQCGQRMRVPRSAVGRTGQCPACGRHIPITNDTLVPKNTSRSGGGMRNAAFRTQRQGPGAREDDKQRFGQAVDLFYNKRYAEALSIFDLLASDYPGNAEIESARSECLRHMKRRSLGDSSEQLALPSTAEINLATVKAIVLEKLAQGTRDEVQLQAATLALEILRMEAQQQVAGGAGHHHRSGESAVTDES